MRLTDYLPDVTGETKDFKALVAAEQPEIEAIWDAAWLVLNNQFILDSTEYGVKWWEKVLKIAPDAPDELDLRKRRILARINEYLPYTMEALKRMLSALCGEDGYSVTLRHEEYYLDVRINPDSETAKGLYYDVRKLLNRVVPANLVIGLTVLHELPPAYVYASAICSNAVIKTVVDWNLFFSSKMETRIGANALISGAAFRTVVDWNLFYNSEMETQIDANSGVTGIYLKTMLN